MGEKFRLRMNNRGIILLRLRKMNNETLKNVAKRMKKSAGWLSEIEQGRGKARLNDAEFMRIIKIYDGEKHKSKFGSWVTKKTKRHRKTIICVDGAVFRYLRKKKGYSLEEASSLLKVSTSHLCNMEAGKRTINQKWRIKLLRTYGYSEGSFKNFSTADKRSKSIPPEYKLQIILGIMSNELKEQLLLHALNLIKDTSSPK